MAEEVNNPNIEEKRFTQADVDALIGRRLAEERKKFPTAEELTAFNSWKAGQQTEADKLKAIETERDTAREEAEQLRHERYLLDKGVAVDDLDYYAFKIGKSVNEATTFEAAADAFLKETSKKSGVKMDTAGSLGGKGGTPSTNETMNAWIRGVKK